MSTKFTIADLNAAADDAVVKSDRRRLDPSPANDFASAEAFNRVFAIRDDLIARRIISARQYPMDDNARRVAAASAAFVKKVSA
jgi:hypothetical protein